MLSVHAHLMVLKVVFGKEGKNFVAESFQSMRWKIPLNVCISGGEITLKDGNTFVRGPDVPDVGMKRSKILAPVERGE